MGVTYFIGLDLGREQDYTAWAVMERRVFSWHRTLDEFVLDTSIYYERDIDYEKSKEELGLIGLSQIPLRTSWEKIAEELDAVISRCFQKNEGSEVSVWVDASGIGDPVIEGFFEPITRNYSACSMHPVKIVPGEEGYKWETKTVSKVHLVDNALVMREKKGFVIAKDLKDQPVMELFEKQIQDFRRKEGKRAGTIRYEAAQGEHDDLVIAFALACLGVEQARGQFMPFFIDLNEG